MKKMLAILLSLVMVLGLFAGGGSALLFPLQFCSEAAKKLRFFEFRLYNSAFLCYNECRRSAASGAGRKKQSYSSADKRKTHEKS